MEASARARRSRASRGSRARRSRASRAKCRARGHPPTRARGRARYPAVRSSPLAAGDIVSDVVVTCQHEKDGFARGSQDARRGHTQGTQGQVLGQILRGHTQGQV